jgi:hypothetical protein
MRSSRACQPSAIKAHRSIKSAVLIDATTPAATDPALLLSRDERASEQGPASWVRGFTSTRGIARAPDSSEAHPFHDIKWDGGVVVTVLVRFGGGERRSSLYCVLGGRTRRHWRPAVGAQFRKGPSGGQTKSGASRSRSGCERLVASEHVPDRLGELSGDVDLGDLRAALFAQALLVARVALGVDRRQPPRSRRHLGRRRAQPPAASTSPPNPPHLSGASS